MNMKKMDIYIYIYREREREREEMKVESVSWNKSIQKNEQRKKSVKKCESKEENKNSNSCIGNLNDELKKKGEKIKIWTYNCTQKVYITEAQFIK
jgi:hypothetical protein